MAKKTEEATQVGGDLAAVNEPTRYTEPNATAPKADYVIATADLFVEGVRAHAAGDRVPAKHVDRWGWSESVRPE